MLVWSGRGVGLGFSPYEPGSRDPIYLLDNPLLCESLSIPPSVCAPLALEAGANRGHRYIGEWGEVIGLDDLLPPYPDRHSCANTDLPRGTSRKRALALLEKNNA